jgi:hypothetical protein
MNQSVPYMLALSFFIAIFAGLTKRCLASEWDPDVFGFNFPLLGGVVRPVHALLFLPSRDSTAARMADIRPPGHFWWHSV